MHMKCSICFDALGPDALPVATRCGHLYCLDCATFNFSRGDATCAICRAPHALKKLVKLFPDYEQESQAAEPTNGRNTSSGAPGAQDADVWDESTLVDIALGRADAVISKSKFSGESQANLRESLKVLRGILRSIYAKMEDTDQTTAVKSEVQRLKQDNTRLKSQLEEQKQRRRQEQKRVAAMLEQERDAFLTVHSELQDRLRRLRREMETMQGKVAESETSRVASEQEMKLWRKSANRYKKKYYVLKAGTMASKKHADSSDSDSLEVV